MSRYQYQPLASWNEFEQLCFALFKNYWETELISYHGRNGSRQNGVDIFGYGKDRKEIWGIQCKGNEIYPEKKISIDKIEDEINKALDFEPKLRRYIIATTMRRDVTLQRELRELIKLRDLPFSVELVFWDDIEDLLAEMPDVESKFYPKRSIRNTSLYERAGFNDRINTVSVYKGEKDGELVFINQYYHFFGMVSERRAWLELGGIRSQPVHKGKIGYQSINVKILSSLIEDFFFGSQVDTFYVDFDLHEDIGSLEISDFTNNVKMSACCYIKDDVVYDDTDQELNKHDASAYLDIRHFMSNLAKTLLTQT